MRLTPLLLLALLTAAVSAAPDPPCSIVCDQAAAPLVRQAACELASYLSRWGEQSPPILSAPRAGLPAIILRQEPQTAGAEECLLASAGRGPNCRVTVRAATPEGLQSGAYALLREYGFGFYLDGDAVPPRPPADWVVPELHGSPAFAIRGSLPWYNFLNSPTTWDDQDFRFFADQLLRSGQNFVGFHSYDYEPFAAYEEGGAVVGGQPLMTTADRVWGTFPLPVREFGFGIGRLFPGPYWGSDVARTPGSREERILAAKALLARGLSYASARGMKTCLGFEVSGDPTDAAEQRRFRARLLQLLQDYPMLDYVWLWQPEGMSMEGSRPPALRSQGGRLYRDWQEAFEYLPTPQRRWEGMRVACYGRLAQQILDGRAPAVRLVLSGWGGDNWLHVSDYFPAWDRVLDKRIVFAALDDIRVRPQVSRYYALPPDRERWAIPWYEYDGDQWFPQANARIFAETVRDARQKGCRGLLAIHWRTKEVGESQALVADCAWRPDRTLAAFYADYGTRRVGARYGAAYGQVLQELDALDYRWLGGGGQSECSNFAWCHVDDPARLAKLGALRARLQAIRKAVVGAPEGTLPSGALGRVDDTLATLDRGVLFNEVAGYMVPGGPVDQALGLPPDDPQRPARCAEVLRSLPHKQFARMLALWAQTITSRGELGVLATINGKAFFDYREKLRRLQEGAGQEPSPAVLEEPAPLTAVISDYQYSSAAAGTSLSLRCAAVAGARAARRLRLECRSPGATTWNEVPLVHVGRALFETEVPPQALQPGWLRYRLRAELPGGSVLWPQCRGEAYRQMTLFPAEILVPRSNTVASPSVADDVPLTGTAAGSIVRLTWPARGGSTLAVQRCDAAGQWQRLGETCDGVWEDAAAPPEATAAYRVSDESGRVRGACSVRTAAAATPPAPQGLSARPRGTAVRLTWGAGDLDVSHYRVERADAATGPFAAVSPELAPEGFVGNSYVDRPPSDGTVYYRVAAYGSGAQPPAYSETAAARAISRTPEPVLSVDFSSGHPAGTVEGLAFTGPHEFVADGQRQVLHTAGGFTIPYSPRLAVPEAFTVALRFRLTEMTPMPVLLSQGAWQAPGYFVQLIGNSLRFYVGGAGCCDRPVDIRPGQWHTAVCVYDGQALLSYLDGALLGEKLAEGPAQPSTAHFTVGRYTEEGPDWTFKGDLDFVRLYDCALEPAMALRRADAPGTLAVDWPAGPAGAVWHQPVRVATTDYGPAAQLDGGLTVPFSDALPAGDTLSIETAFLLHSTADMPVLINQGLWPDEGYMVQVLDGRLRFHLGGIGSLDCGPPLQTERWYALRCGYDGAAVTASLDGQQIGELRSNAPLMPSLRPLRLGRYELDEPAYVFHGLLGRTVITAR